jgi:hypothetical protein
MIRHDGICIDREANSISYQGTAFFWRGSKNIAFRICQHVILAGPVTVKDVADLLYGDDPSGGPEFYCGTVRTVVCRVRKVSILLNIGLDIRTSGCRGFQKLYINRERMLHSTTPAAWPRARFSPRTLQVSDN